MRHFLKTVLALSCFVAGLQFASVNANATTTCGSFPVGTKTLTAAQCVTIRKALADYIALVKKLLGNTPLANLLITAAQKDTDKVCPQAPGNGYTPDTTFECGVLDSTSSFVTSLGLDSAGNVTNVINSPKTICMSATACQNIVSAKFTTFGSNTTSRCSDPNDLTVQHFSDADLQSKINALP